ncbi:MAG: rhodanese-like domain-containing protein [Chloroflexota bacterium]
MFIQKLFSVLLLLSVLLVACSSPTAAPVVSSSSGSVTGSPVRVEGGAYLNITPTQLTEMLKSKDFVFINTHIPYEGEIEKTDAFIPYDQTMQLLNKYPSDKSAKIVLYCQSGRMSAIAAQELVKAGYINVWNLDGGMVAWERGGYKVKYK